jgi:hypothetical protein
MNIGFFFTHYVAWHYTKAFRRIYGIWTNFLWFVYHFFSIPLLLKTFFEPWQRMHEEYKKGVDPQELAGALIVNLLLRLVGMVLRAVVIVVGLALFLLILVGGLLCFLAWLILPLAIVYLLYLGIINIIGAV